MGWLFGTDGVRGIANVELTPELAFQLGRAGSYVLAAHESGSRPRILVGKDTRISGDMLEAALMAGICSTGADVLTAGIIPTPAVAYLTGQYQASCGVVISASHNPAADNGIKFLGGDGYKLPDELETEIEELVRTGTADLNRPQGGKVGRVYDIKESLHTYIDYLVGCYTSAQRAEEITVVVDCANGAASKAGPEMLRKIGARVIAINNHPNGLNINDKCGSTHIDGLKEAVLQYRADVGVAYDGDADRCLLVDDLGRELDGDHIIMITALDMHRNGELNPSHIVATVMSNIGLEIALRKEGVAIQSCKVGDRYVLEKMQASGALLGGEQSGHIIFSRYATTGDGLLTSLKIIETMVRSRRKLSELAEGLEKRPQLLVNVKLENKEVVLNHPQVVTALATAEKTLGLGGKLVVRPSGTEPLVRIMAQGSEHRLIEEVIEKIKNAIDEARQDL